MRTTLALPIALLALLASLPAWSQNLVQLLEAKSFAEAEALLKSGVDVNLPSSDGTTPLHWAVYHGHLELTKALLRAEAEPNSRNDYGSSPLMEAAIAGNLPLIEALLDAGAHIESPNLEGQTALMAVARTGNIEAARLLISRGAAVNTAEKWGGQTALMWASARQQPAMVDFLIEEGADVDVRAIDRNWERRVTAEPRVKEMFQGGLTALLYAAREDCLDCVRHLLDAGADINKPDPDNVSPLIMALLNMRFDIAKLLIERGADVNQWDYWGRTPLYAATDTNIVPLSQRGDLPPVQSTTGLEIARLLLEKGANPNYYLKLPPLPREIAYDRAGDNPVMTTGSTPLQRAAYGGDVDMMKLLLANGADWTMGNINGVTPLIAMTNSGGSRGRNKDETKMIAGLEVLLNAGADINQQGGANGETPLHTAARLNMLGVVQFIVDHGGNLFAKDARDLLPLDYATGKADSQSFGNFNVVGELPEMAALLRTLMGQTSTP
jgi:ankyrin repeat protein